MPYSIPSRSRGQEGGAIGEAVSCTSFGEATYGAPLTGAFSAPRMRTPLGPSRTSWSLHRKPTASDALMVTRRHARVGLLTARCAVSMIVGPLRSNDTESEPASQRTPGTSCP
jgi:hypothetical protein